MGSAVEWDLVSIGLFSCGVRVTYKVTIKIMCWGSERCAHFEAKCGLNRLINVQERFEVIVKMLA